MVVLNSNYDNLLEKKFRFVIISLRKELSNLFLLFQQFVIYLVLGVLFLIASSMMIHAVASSQEYQSWIPSHTNHSLIASLVSHRIRVGPDTGNLNYLDTGCPAEF